MKAVSSIVLSEVVTLLVRLKLPLMVWIQPGFGDLMKKNSCWRINCAIQVATGYFLNLFSFLANNYFKIFEMFSNDLLSPS